MMPMKILKKLASPITSRYIANATIVEGILKGTDKPFRCLFVENLARTNYEEYIVPRTYSTPPQVVKRWRIWLPNLKRVLEKYSDTIDVGVAVLPDKCERHFQGKYAFKGGPIVRQIIDTSGTWENIFGSFRSGKKQFSNKVERKLGLTHQISKDLEDFELFYYRMFVPHIKSQFDTLAHIDSYNDMRKYFLRGFLLFVVADGIKMAGALCVIENRSLMFRRTGLLDGNEEFKKRGAQLALYHFMIHYAFDNGLTSVNTMESRSLLNDGVYANKREWGAAVFPVNDARTSVYYFITNKTSEVPTFFANNPAIINGEDGLYGLTGWPIRCKNTVLDKKELSKKYYSPGLKGMILLAPDGDRTTVRFNEVETQGLTTYIN
ncbi:MAG: hypothetical protein V7754_16970 [Halioglobus sp.]